MLRDAKERTLKVPKTKSPLMEFIEVIYSPHWIQFRMDLVCNRKPRLTLGIPYVHTVHASVPKRQAFHAWVLDRVDGEIVPLHR